MNQNYIEIVKQKLKTHQMSGKNSNLNIFQVAELLDIVNGRSYSIKKNNDLAISNLYLN